MQKEKKEVIEKVKDILIKIDYIIFCYIHGSFLDKDRFNDIDLALYIDENIIKETECVDSEISLSLKLEKEFNKAIDIKFLNFSPLPFRYHASAGLLLFCKDDTKREEFLCKTWAEYFDFLPISKIYLREMLNVEV